MKLRAHLKDCKSGDVLMEDIYIQGRNIPLAVKGTVLDTKLIDKFIDNKVFKVLVEKSGEIKPSGKTSKTEKLMANYSRSVSDIKSIFQGIASGKDLDLDRIADMSTDLVENSDDIFRVVESINRTKGMDEYTYMHSINVALYSMLIARWMGLDEEAVEDVIKAGLLHDIGKSRVPDEILNKKGPLTESEFEKIKEHPVLGYEICRDMDGIKGPIKEAVLFHHEKTDGSGYPNGLKHDEIGLYSKIVSVADIYDAITSERVYKHKQTPFETFREIRDIAYEKLDMKITDLFLSNISSFYVGTKVRMNTGDVAEISFIYPHKIDTPLVKLGEKIIDTSIDKSYYIEELI